MEENEKRYNTALKCLSIASFAPIVEIAYIFITTSLLSVCKQYSIIFDGSVIILFVCAFSGLVGFIKMIKLLLKKDSKGFVLLALFVKAFLMLLLALVLVGFSVMITDGC